jgi:hypothetical protein
LIMVRYLTMIGRNVRPEVSKDEGVSETR